MTKFFQKWWRIIFWPAMVIAALNIENVASTLQIDKLLTSEWPLVSRLVAALLSDTAFHIALVIAGGGLFAWGSHLMRKFDEAVPGLRWIGLNCEELEKAYLDRVLTTRSYTLRRTEKMNRRLAHYGIAPVPLPDMDSRHSKRHVAQYLHALAMHLKDKDLQGAQGAGAVYLTTLEAVGFVPLPPPDTEPEKQP